MPISHTKKFGIYHYDSFDLDSVLLGEADSVEEAEKFIKDMYEGRISEHGADSVDIVNLKGEIVKKFPVC